MTRPTFAQFFGGSALAFALLFQPTCTVGEGEGSVSGTLVVPDCDGDVSSYNMDPDFFAAVPAQNQLLIRIQRGGDLQEYADSLVIAVDDVQKVLDRIESKDSSDDAIPVELERPPGSAPAVPAPLVRMSLSLRRTCGSRSLNPGDPKQVVLHAISGTIRFAAILREDASSRDTNAKRIQGTFDVVLRDPRKPSANTGGPLRGFFKFFYQRGGPAQPFP